LKEQNVIAKKELNPYIERVHFSYFRKGVSMKRHGLVFVPIVLLLLLFDSLSALPRFAVRTGAKCQSCHVNPTGGGMRNFYGSTSYGREALPIKSWQEEFSLEEFTTQLNDFVSVGADFRTLYYTEQANNGQAFWQMQGDIYLRANVAKKINMYLDKGLYSGFEIFGIANILPAEGYIKVGRFWPAFGLRIDDHTIFVRQYTGFNLRSFERAEDTGVEVGFLPGAFKGVVAVSNGGAQGIPSDKVRALLGRVELMFSASSFNFLVGGSAYRLAQGRSGKTIAGGFLGAALENNAVLLGEVDYIDDKTGVADIKSLVSYVELDYALIQGLDLKVAYDFYDPDVKNKSGSFSRYSFGFEFFPISGIEVRPLYRLYKEEPTDLKNDEVHVLIHFYL